ncbi:MAG TPA: prepilin-type N-terminal cleavage/methylation domain-containing protein, partial [Candidatus Saccharimonadales bacterium]|nr:prepilin-type N-terminal cleavage/methylation domain-containing protein [Candidatus Saccharimonadales bacterium]
MKKNIKGFTIIELIVVIVIIGILSTISIVGLNVIQQGSRNTQRSSAMSAIAEALEKYYMKNGEYPSCAMMTQSTSATTVANALFPGFSPSNLTAPTDSTPDHNSFVCTNPPASPAQYSYEYGVTSYTLQYQEEGTSNIDSLDSRHHANAPNYNLTITCPNGTPSGSGTFAAGSSDPFGCTPNQYYSVTGWTGSAGCSGGSPIYLNDNKTCNAITAPTPLSAPSAPVVTDSNLPSPTTYSWNAASCGTGNTAGYRYDY